METPSLHERMPEVRYVFQAKSCGFGSYELVEDPDSKILAKAVLGKSGRGYGRCKIDPKHRGLLSTENIVTDWTTVPSLLVKQEVSSPEDYATKMEQLQQLLKDHNGVLAYPFGTFVLFLVISVALEIYLYQTILFLSLFVPSIAFFVAFSAAQSAYRRNVEDIFESYKSMFIVTFLCSNKGNYAVLTLRLRNQGNSADTAHEDAVLV